MIINKNEKKKLLKYMKMQMISQIIVLNIVTFFPSKSYFSLFSQMHLKLLHLLHLDSSLNDAANLRTSKNTKHCNEDLTQ